MIRQTAAKHDGDKRFLKRILIALALIEGAGILAVLFLRGTL